MRRILIGLALLAALTACNPIVAYRGDDAEAVIQTTFERLRTGDPRFSEELTPELYAKTTPEILARAHAEIPPGPISAHKALYSTRTIGHGRIGLIATDEYDFGDNSLLLQTQLVRPSAGGPWRIDGLHLQAFTAALARTNAFTAPGKSPGQYIFLLVTLLSPALMIAALVKVIRARGLRRKWLWGILAFIGLGTFHMNWTSGDNAVNYLSIQLIGFGVVKAGGGMAPWVLSFTLPVLAVLILTGVLANPRRARPKGPTPEEVF